MDSGAALRSARERRGISLEDLSRTTKINVATLGALERNEIDGVPGGIFLRGFLRAYARAVGLDAEETVQQYLAQLEPRPPAVVSTESHDTSSEPIPVVHRKTVFDAAHVRAFLARPLALRVALAIVLAAYLAARVSRTPAPPPAVTAERSASESLKSSTVRPRTETGTSGVQQTNAPAARLQDGIHLDIRTVGPCWVYATADGSRVAYRLMQAGERHTIAARNEVVLKIGDPAAFTYRINEMPGRPLGGAGRTGTIRITMQNYREFVSP
jgi:cytoskeletal protein RodZ